MMALQAMKHLQKYYIIIQLIQKQMIIRLNAFPGLISYGARNNCYYIQLRKLLAFYINNGPTSTLYTIFFYSVCKVSAISIFLIF